MKTSKRNWPLAKVYRLLEPGPVVMLTTLGNDRPDIMTMSWHTMMDFAPPLVGLIVDAGSLTFAHLRASRECVINIPTVELAAQTVGCGNTSGRKTDKFKTFHLTPAPAARVHPPLIDECYANLECKLVDEQLADRYNFFIMEVVKAWIRPALKNPQTLHHLGWGRFMVAGKVIKLPSKMK